MIEQTGKSIQGDNHIRQAYFRARDYHFPLGRQTYIMGILNVTPDSFSDGGRWNSIESAVAKAKEMEIQGADMIDIGGESTRPGHTPVSVEEELARVLPVVQALHREIKIPISIDTWKSQVAELAVREGASIVNDVWGCQRDLQIASIAAKTGAGLVLMYNATNEDIKKSGSNVLDDAIRFLRRSIQIAREAGVSDDQLMTDPGIGFGMDTNGSLHLIRNTTALRGLGFPVLIGPSRKRFIGAILDRPVEDRLLGTVAVCCASACLGADFVRVHDVSEIKEALKMVDAVIREPASQEILP